MNIRCSVLVSNSVSSMPAYVYADQQPSGPGHRMPPSRSTAPAYTTHTETTESSVSCFAPWSLFVLALGVSLLVSGVLNLSPSPGRGASDSNSLHQLRRWRDSHWRRCHPDPARPYDVPQGSSEASARRGGLRTLRFAHQADNIDHADGPSSAWRPARSSAQGRLRPAVASQGAALW